MRPTSRAFVGAILIAGSALPLSAAETGSRWWPFGRRDEAKVAQPPTTAAPSQQPLESPRRHSALNPASPPAAAAAPLAQAPPLAGSAADVTGNENWMLSSPKRKISWPRLTKPQASKTGVLAQKTDPDAARNSWVEKTPVEPPATPLKPLKDGAQKVAKNTKAAWHKTVDALTPGEAAPEPATRPNSSRIAKSEPKSTFWQRLRGEKQEVAQPKTVPEWMAQERVDRK